MIKISHLPGNSYIKTKECLLIADSPSQIHHRFSVSPLPLFSCTIHPTLVDLISNASPSIPELTPAPKCKLPPTIAALAILTIGTCFAGSRYLDYMLKVEEQQHHLKIRMKEFSIERERLGVGVKRDAWKWMNGTFDFLCGYGELFLSFNHFYEDHLLTFRIRCLCTDDCGC